MELFIFKGKNICAHIDDRTATEKVIVECNMKEVWERFELYNKKSDSNLQHSFEK